jgi:hypothetical protein
LELLSLLAARLERLSADSRFSHRASGLRGNILKLLDEAGKGAGIASSRLELLTASSFEILRAAAEEIPDLEELLKRWDSVDGNAEKEGTDHARYVA